MISVSDRQILEFDAILDIVGTYCVTPLGVKDVQSSEVHTNDFELREIQQSVSGLMTLIRSGIDIPLERVESVSDIMDRARPDFSVLPAEDLLIIAQLLRVSRSLNKITESIGLSEIRFLFQRFHDLNSLLKAIVSVIHESGTIRDTASAELKRLRNEIRFSESKIRTKTQELAKHKYAEYVHEDLSTLRNGRPVLAVKAEHAAAVQGVVHGYSGTGATVYIEPNENVQASAELHRLMAAEMREIDRLLRDITQRVREWDREIRENEIYLTELDAFHARARYGLSVLGTFPQFNRESQELSIEQGYHPLLLRDHDRASVTPITIRIGSDDSKVILISGPNAGGKTVAIKTVGILVLMNQAGIPIPVNEQSRFPIYRSLFCDIGDHQSISNDLSTFTSHLTRMKTILESSKYDTLVLIDELGTGTDPREGSLLAIEYLKRLNESGTSVLATTHLGELKLAVHEFNGMLNASMRFDVDALTSTYEYQEGIPGQSHAFEIARRMGIPEDIVTSAQHKQDSETQQVESLIADLNERIRREKTMEAELDRTLARAKSVEEMYEKKLKRIRDFETKTREKAIQEADSLLANVNRTIEQVIQDLRNNQAEKTVIRTGKDKIKSLKKMVQAVSDQHAERWENQNHEWAIGDRVKHQALGIFGNIESIRNNRIEVQFGHMKMECVSGDLEFIQAADDSENRVHINTSDIASTVKNEIDVRGLLVDDAWDKVDEYIDMARVSGWETVTIIHGKGTGALRAGLNQRLQHDKRIQKKRRGNEGEGDTGVTVLELRMD